MIIIFLQLLLLLLLIYPGLVNGVELNTSDTSLTEDCDYTSQGLCGDVCIKWGYLCSCNGQVFSLGENKKCCVENFLERQCVVGDDGFGYCKSGRTLHETQPCNSQCSNGYYKCKANDQCVPGSALCHGVAWCPDKSDVKPCKRDLQCVARTTGGFTKHDILSTIVTQHSECRYHKHDNDGKYHTVSRIDESNLNIVTKANDNIDYTSIKNCSAQNGQQGLTCDGYHGGCLPNFGWCRNDVTATCNNNSFSSNDKNLCSNATFWRTLSCDLFIGGVFRAKGERCSGPVQSCYYPWYNTLNKHYEVGVLENKMNLSISICYVIPMV